MANETEIKRDIPLLYEKIGQCHRTIGDFERAILDEERAMMGLQLEMGRDRERVAAGKRPHYEEASMQANIERHKTNIETFRASIEKEKASITRFQEMIATLEEDMKRPVEIVADMRAPGGPKFRNME
jgi:chromosome segregation ATPase